MQSFEAVTSLDRKSLLTGIGIGLLVGGGIASALFLYVLDKQKRWYTDSLTAEVVPPEVTQAEPLSELPEGLIVNVTKDGKYTVMSKEYDAQQLTKLLDQASRHNAGRQSVLIRGHADAAFKFVVGVIDICNKVSIADYNVAVAGEE